MGVQSKPLCPIFESQRQVSLVSPESIVTERKFDTAIRLSQVVSFKNRYANNQPTLDDKILIEALRRQGVNAQDVLIDHAVYSRLLQEVLSSVTPARKINSKENDQITHIWSLIQRNLSLQIGYMTDRSALPEHASTRAGLPEYFASKMPDNVLRRLVLLTTRLSVMVEKLGLIQSVRSCNKTVEAYLEETCKLNKWEDQAFNVKAVWSNRLCAINLGTERWYIMPRPYLLMIHNKVSDLISVLVCANAMSGVSGDPKLYEACIDLTREMCRLNIRHQSQFFTIIKSLESLVVAEALRLVDQWDNNEFYYSLIDELYSEHGFNYDQSRIKQILSSVDIPSQHELGCLSKIVGHPLVNMVTGAKTLHKKTTEVYTLDKITLAKCECHIKINYIRNHILREKSWPPCTLTTNMIHPAIRDGWAQNKDPYSVFLKEKHGTPDVLDFIHVELLPNMKFSKLENTIPYLKDKTISLMRTKTVGKYLEKAVEAWDDPESSQEQWKDTRLLLYYLMNPTSSLQHDKYIDMYAKSDTLDAVIEYLVIRAVPKEKELKIDPRFFGCKTYEERFRSLAQEKNAMKFLEYYCDEQAMTLSELELSRRIIAFRRLRLAYRDHYILYIVVDASSWNNHFRSETVDDIMKNTLDPIFDTTIFGKTHEAFKKTLVHVPDEEEAILWDGQAGGIEGLNQDTWVITYLGQIKTALDPLNLKYHALCKGDDLRIAICIPKHAMSPSDIPRFKNDVMKRVSNTAAELGHKIKIEESYGSLRYFAFSKEASISDIMLPQTLRKIQKVHGYNNAFLPYLDDMAGSTYSNAHAACKVSANVLPCEITGLFWLYYYLTQHPSYQLLAHHEICGLSLVPSMCGGLPMIYHHNMYVRAESDLLAPFIGLLRYVLDVDPDVGAVMSNFCIMPNDPPKSLERVYKDPYSITTSMPALPSAVLRNKMELLLPRITKNQDVLNLIRAAKSVSSQEFVRALDSSNILPARVFAALYAASPKGMLSEFLAKFETARSVLQVLVLGSGRQSARRILRRLVRQEIILQTWRVNVIKGNVRGYDYMPIILSVDCPGKAANLIREESWRKPVETVTMPPLQHQVYMTTPDKGARSLHDIQSHFTIKCQQSTSTVTVDNRPHYSAGPCRPFEGYTTRTGTVEPTMSFVEKDVLLSKLQNVIELASWTNKMGLNKEKTESINSNLHVLIAKIVEQYTDHDLRMFAPFVGCRRSGTVQHHIRCPGYRESIVPNTLLNMYTHTEGESDSNMHINSQPGQHYKINFLHIYCYAVVSLFLHNEIYCTPSYNQTVWCVTRDCDDCMSPIDETPIVIDERLVVDIDFSALKITKLTEDAMEVLRKSLDVHEGRVYMVPDENTQIDNQVACEGVIQELLETLVVSKNALITRYTQHAMTSEGKQVLGAFAVKNKRREIGLSELKRLTPRDLTECLMTVIYYSLMNHLGWDGTTKLEHHLVLIPAQELPWYELVSYLHRYGRLADVFKHMMQRTMQTHSNAYTTPENCSIALGSQLLVHADYFLRQKTIVVLTNLATPQIKMHIARQLFALARVFFNTHVKSPLPRSWDDTWSNDQKRMLLVYIYYWTIPFHDREEINIELTNIGGRSIPVSELLLSDVDDILELYDADDIQVLHENLSGQCRMILRELGCSYDVLLNIHKELSEVSIQYLTNCLDQFEVRLIMTTLSDCIGKVREVSHEEDHSDTSSVERIIPEITELSASPPKRSIRVVPVSTASEETWTSGYSHTIKEEFSSIPEPTRNLECLSRPYGISNCSMSTLLYILTEFNIIKRMNQPPIFASCLADGVGNMATLIARMAPRSRILYSTLHTEVGLMYKPAELLMTADDTNCEIIYESIKLGMTDLAERYVVDYMAGTMPVNHLVTCDIEFSNWSLNILEAYRNILTFYVRTRGGPSILVLKINHKFVNETLWVLHQVCAMCEYVYLVHPPTIRHHNISYIVAWMQVTVSVGKVISAPCPLSKTNLNICGAYEKFRHSRWLSYRSKCTEGLDGRGKINPVPVCPMKMRVGMPSLFLSLVFNVLHLFIDPDWLVNVPDVTDDGVMYMSNMARYLLTQSPLQNYYQVMHDHLYNNKPVIIKNRPYDLNLRAHRVYVTQQLMKMKGLLDYAVHVQHTNDLIMTNRIIKTMYLQIYDMLLPRDKYINEPRSHFSRCIMDSGVNVSYYSNYINGVEIAQTYFAYCRTRLVSGKERSLEALEHFKPSETTEYQEIDDE